MRFDFSGLKSYPPPGMSVQEANSELRLYHERKKISFVIRPHSRGQFNLYSRSIATGGSWYKEVQPNDFVMRSDLPRLLFLLGYTKASLSRVAITTDRVVQLALPGAL
jgi:hypothetical protein